MKKLVTAFVLFTMFGQVAAAIYEYSGPNFDQVQGIYTTSNKAAGKFSTAAALAPGLNLADVSSQIISFNYCDGVQTLTIGFNLSTNGSGAVSQMQMTIWSIPALPTKGAVAGTLRGIQNEQDSIDCTDRWLSG